MAESRDYGAFGAHTTPDVLVDTKRYTDVYLATHDGEGNRLPYSMRSFISFTYGGKHIEDFNVIAVTDGDRWSHPVYADFTDIVNDPDVYDGQLYWNTHHKANTWDLQLATDCMTEQNLNDFKNWFKPGVIRELVLAEHPNRAIWARVSSAPSLSVLPFEEQSVLTVGNMNYPVKTTVYKGEISISFVMDYPFWHAIKNWRLIPDPDFSYADGADYNGDLNVEDTVKVIVEDNLPLVASNVNFIGNEDAAVVGVLPAYMYYAGTAPCRPIITFSFTPRLDDNGYIDNPHNAIASGGEEPYNFIKFTSTNEYELSLTTPGILSSYNYARQLLDSYAEGISWEELRIAFRDNLKHYDVRAFMMRLIDKYQSQSSSAAVTTTDITGMKRDMPSYLGNGAPASISCTIDCKNGRATIGVSHCKLVKTEDPDTGVVSWTPEYSSAEEDAGDMLKSSYLKLEDRNFLLDGQVVGTGDQNRYTISTNFSSISNFKVSYENLYY